MTPIDEFLEKGIIKGSKLDIKTLFLEEEKDYFDGEGGFIEVIYFQMGIDNAELPDAFMRFLTTMVLKDIVQVVVFL